MPTAAFTTLGCKVNQYETQRILESFEERGFAITEFNTPADVYVINTCSVTQAAERKSRQMVRRVSRINPDAVVVMTGCYGEMARIKGEIVDEASLIVPNQHKLETLHYVLERFPDLHTRLESESRPVLERPSHRRTRATLKVQDGCNVFCAFCSIPYTRSLMLSRTPEDILGEVRRRVEQGYKEVVVTGVLVGAYGQDGFKATPGANMPRAYLNQQPTLEVDLSDILRMIAQVDGIERVRLSSIEPTQVTDRLLDAFATEPKLCPHLHIPLQSGDTSVLRAMNRPYDQDFYLERCRKAYERIPNLALTADIMVGFPGEGEEEFESTLHVVRTVGFARAHIFRYSPRPNTPAASVIEQVSEEIKEARSRVLAAACRDTQQAFIRQYIGRTLPVLVEGKTAPETESGASGNEGNIPVVIGGEGATGLLGGYTNNYIRVQFTGGSHLVGKVVPVQLLEPTSDGAIGEAGGAHFAPLEAPDDAHFIPLATLTAALK
ncbi:MAG: tRNA (N(6)-L-threonylcarbamoyladenosine(37)-C(2))-methylthiotransferase MtaB [Armatimonadetes bacterium]|nr:tRNA (N(6)-L-threonylcarbamoyladenosine(37)-C(2))-methylthiotransferase MtaB [Armatimonadota bacterium]